MKLQQSVNWSWAVSQTDLWFCTTFYMLTRIWLQLTWRLGTFSAIEYSGLYSGLRLNNIFLLSRGTLASVLQ